MSGVYNRSLALFAARHRSVVSELVPVPEPYELDNRATVREHVRQPGLRRAALRRHSDLTAGPTS